MNNFKETLKHYLDNINMPYDEQQIERCEAYYQLVIETNKHTNLTRITSEEDAAEMHFASAIHLLRLLDLPKRCRVIDIGTGAGFPGIPLKLFRLDFDMTLLDSSKKKTDFVKDTTQSMGITTTVMAARAEDAARTALWETFDVVVSRAVAPFSMLLELCVPFLKTGGVFAAWKGATYKQEIEDATDALRTLSCHIKESHYVGPGAIILIEKQKPTPDKYPRRFSKIKSNPL